MMERARSDVGRPGLVRVILFVSADAFGKRWISRLVIGAQAFVARGGHVLSAAFSSETMERSLALTGRSCPSLRCPADAV